MNKVKNVLNKPIFNLYDMSIARGLLYAIAIMWIVLFHSGFKFSSEALTWIQTKGDCGVDIFFFLSGISLYFSYTKNRNVKQFYSNRFWKILPVYYLIYIGIFLYDTISTGDTFLNFFLKMTMIDYFRKGSASTVPWFLVAIIIVYLLYPLLYKIFFDEYEHKGVKLAFVFIICHILYVVAISTYYGVLRTFSERYFIILLGIAMGKLVYDKKEVKLWQGLVVLFTFVMLLLLYLKFPTNRMKYLMYIPLTLIYIFILSWIYKINKKIHLNFVNKTFDFIGRYTFEIYIVHILLAKRLFNILTKNGWNFAYSNFWYQLICFFGSIVLSILIGMAVNAIVKLIRRKLRENKEKKMDKSQEAIS